MKKIILFDIDNTLFDTGLFKKSELTTYKTYDEIHKTLEALQEIALLGIFSEGDLSFQGKKLKETLLEPFFSAEHTHIFVDKVLRLPDVLGKYKNYTVFLVDDKLSVLGSAKKQVSSLFTVWMQRGEYANTQERFDGFTPDAIIVDLKELEAIVKNN